MFYKAVPFYVATYFVLVGKMVYLIGSFAIKSKLISVGGEH